MTYNECLHEASYIKDVLNGLIVLGDYTDKMMLGELLIGRTQNNELIWFYTIDRSNHKKYCINIGTNSIIGVIVYEGKVDDSQLWNLCTKDNINCSSIDNDKFLIYGFDECNDQYDMIRTEEEYFMYSTLHSQELLDSLTVSSLVKQHCVEIKIELLYFSLPEFFYNKHLIMHEVHRVKAELI